MARPAIRPVVWDPPSIPDRARSLVGTRSLPLVRTIPITGKSPEDVVVDGEGRLITGVEGGRILRLDRDGRHIETIADTGGRPMGIEVLGDGRLVICDSERGLLGVDPESGEVELLVAEVAGEPLLHCNNAVAAADGTIYFSDSSRRFGFDHWKADVLEHSGTGRLLRRDPGGEVEVLLEGLQFANGVALAPDGSFVVVAETGSYRITRLRLSGERAGEADTFMENLPGFPDNLAFGTDGLIWVALGSVRSALLDQLNRWHPVWRKVLWALPESLQPAPKAPVWVLGVDLDGGVVHDLQGEVEAYHLVTGVREHQGTLYLASLFERTLAAIDLGA